LLTGAAEATELGRLPPIATSRKIEAKFDDKGDANTPFAAEGYVAAGVGGQIGPLGAPTCPRRLPRGGFFCPLTRLSRRIRNGGLRKRGTTQAPKSVGTSAGRKC
jgi:hypothetical protein